MSVRSVSVRVIANVSEYGSAMKQMARDTKAFRDELKETAAKGKGDLTAVANGAIAFGAALGGALAVGIGQAAKFDHAMAQVNAVSGATAEEFDAMRAAALEMGSTTVFSASEAALATEELAKAGLNAAQITGGALAGALDLAAAGGVGLAESATIAANTLNQFQLDASEMTSVADTFAGAANSSATSVTGLGESLKNAGTFAAQSGLSVQETIGILAAFGDQALTGAEAGTALRTTLLRLMAPTGAAKKEMDRLGISIYDANGETLSAVEIVRQLENGLAGLSMEQRTAAINTIFGAEALAGANIILAEGAQGISEYIDKVSEQGAAADTASKRLDSLQGDVTMLTSALEGLAIQSSGGATDGLRIITQTATELLGVINEIPGPVMSTVTVIGLLTAGGLLLSGMAIRARDQIAQMNAQLAATGPAGAKAATALSKVGRAAGTAIGVLGGIQVASAALAVAFDTNLNPQIEAFATGLERWATSGKTTGESARILGEDFEHLEQSLTSAADSGFTRGLAAGIEGVLPFMKNMDDSLAKSTERVEAMDAALTQLYQADPEAAAAAWSRITEIADEQGISIERLKEIFPEYQGAMESATAATDEAVEVIPPFTAELEILASQFGLTGESAEEAVTEMIQSWADGSAAFIDLLGAYNDGLSELGGNTELTTEGFIEQLRRQAEAQAEWSDNLIELSHRGVGGMINELAAMGPEGAEMVALLNSMTDEELQEVVELWGLRGDQTGQELARGILEGTANSIDGIENLQTWINGLESKEVTITTRHVNQYIVQEFGTRANTIVERWGGVTHHARHGVLRQAEVFSTLSPARYAFAEPATQGEAFIPKSGNYQRSMAILEEAASWYGAEVVPAGKQWRGSAPVMVAAASGDGAAGTAGSPVETRVFFDFTNADSEFGRALRKMVRIDGGGDVQRAFGRRG